MSLKMALEEGAAGGLPITIHSRKEHLGPSDTDLVTGMLQQCLHFQLDLSERQDKKTIRQDKKLVANAG